MSKRRTVLAVIAVTVAIAWTTSGVSIASASTTALPAGPVSTNPADNTPQINLRGVVRQLAQCGNTMYASGAFSTVTSPVNGVTYSRHNVFAFNATSFQVLPWNPDASGEVTTVETSADCSAVYVGGTFSRIGGAAAINIAKLSAQTGALNASFGHTASGSVDRLLMVNGHLLAGGHFKSVNGGNRPHFASLNPLTGRDDGYVNLAVSGSYGSLTSTHVYDFKLSHSGNRLLVPGVFTTVGGQPRRQVFMVDLAPGGAQLDPWYVPDFNQNCLAPSEQFYVKGVSWSPDDARVYTGSTGFMGAPLCDVAAAFSSSPSGNQQAIWINPTGCDSLYATAADASTVYIGGHQRYANNFQGCDAAGPGAVARPGIGGLSPATGLATAWNPTRSRGHGIGYLLLTPAGLWAASDTFFNSTSCGHEQHPGICFLPY